MARNINNLNFPIKNTCFTQQYLKCKNIENIPVQPQRKVMWVMFQLLNGILCRN